MPVMIRATGQCRGLAAKVRIPARTRTAGHQVPKISPASSTPALSRRSTVPTATMSRPKKSASPIHRRQVTSRPSVSCDEESPLSGLGDADAPEGVCPEFGRLVELLLGVDGEKRLHVGGGDLFPRVVYEGGRPVIVTR